MVDMGWRGGNLTTEELARAWRVAFDPRIEEPVRTEYVTLLLEEAEPQEPLPLTTYSGRGHAR
jgi:hypothetical protein